MVITKRDATDQNTLNGAPVEDDEDGLTEGYFLSLSVVTFKFRKSFIGMNVAVKYSPN